nr:hypothetical protein [uncultured Acetatifactor sp.]
MYEDYLQKALGNIITSRGALYEYNGHPHTKLGKNLKNIAAYNVQQAIEHILKYLIYNNVGYNHGGNNIKQIFFEFFSKKRFHISCNLGNGRLDNIYKFKA